MLCIFSVDTSNAYISVPVFVRRQGPFSRRWSRLVSGVHNSDVLLYITLLFVQPCRLYIEMDRRYYMYLLCCSHRFLSIAVTVILFQKLDNTYAVVLVNVSLH